MTTFDSREKAFEDKYAHDSEMMFKATARRNRLFGEWIAGKLGLAGAEAKDYGKAVVQADLEEPGDADIMRKVKSDLKAAGLEISDHRLETRLDECMAEAKAQILDES